MSRTRIVKGKITEIIGGDYNIFSEGSIIDNAAEIVTEKGENSGVSYGSPKTPLPPNTQAKCAIHFRPNSKYKDAPSFGFDWVKIADTGYRGDVWYLNYIGKYKNPADLSKLKQVYYNGVFQKSSGEFNKICNTFEKLLLQSKKDSGDPNYMYYVPKMTLRKNHEANLILKIKIDESPKKLNFEYDKSIFEISDYKNDDIQSKNKGNRTLPIKIKCKNVFSSQKSIIIKADNEVCGKLNILPNNFRYDIKVVFVKVITNLEGKPKTGKILDIEKTKLKQILVQSYVKSVVEEDILDLSVFFTSTWFKWWYTQKGQIKTQALHNYLNEKLHAKDIKYKDYYKVYVFGDTSNGLNGIAEGVGHVMSAIVFPGRFASDPSLGSSVHEILHAIGLYHTFDNDSSFTFERAVLDNVMDYSHWNKINRISTTHWQWKLLQNNLSGNKTTVK